MMSANGTGHSEQSRVGFTKAAEYDKYRPSYPKESVDALLNALRLSDARGATIVDLAAGTGKFTELLSGHDGDYKIVAVEPNEHMRSELVKKELASVTVEDGLANSIPLADGQADAVVIAQAFHWFAKDPQTLEEIYRVLKPGAFVGMIWNTENYNAPLHYKVETKWEDKLRTYMHTFDDHHDRFRHYKWPAAFENQPYFQTPYNDETFSWTVWLQKDALYQRWSTLSQLAVLEGEEAEEARRVFDDALAGDDVEINEAGEIALHGVTYILWSQRLDG